MRTPFKNFLQNTFYIQLLKMLGNTKSYEWTANIINVFI